LAESVNEPLGRSVKAVLRSVRLADSSEGSV